LLSRCALYIGHSNVSNQPYNSTGLKTSLRARFLYP
jgi:hypothetical protein